MPGWIPVNSTVFWWLTGFSIIAFVGTLIVVPILVAMIPADYFVRDRRHPSEWAAAHPVLRLLGIIGKNLLGLILVAVGIVMLVTPGQGLLTILIGILLLDFPGKFPLERWLITRRPVRRSVNWLRQRSGKPPIRVDGLVVDNNRESGEYHE